MLARVRRSGSFNQGVDVPSSGHESSAEQSAALVLSSGAVSAGADVEAAVASHSMDAMPAPAVEQDVAVGASVLNDVLRPAGPQSGIGEWLGHRKQPSGV